jgi:hypothetical protein
MLKSGAVDLDGVVHGAPLRERSGVEQVAEGLSFEEFADKIRRAVVSADVEDREDVGMIERGGRARLLLEAAHPISVLSEVPGDDFQRDVAREPCVAGAIDLAHASGPEHHNDFIGTETGTCAEGHRRGGLCNETVPETPHIPGTALAAGAGA